MHGADDRPDPFEHAVDDRFFGFIGIVDANHDHHKLRI